MDDSNGTREAIIPGLPDDLALLCLARISHGYHGLLKSVCRKWRDAVRSSDYASLKAKQGWCGNWLFACGHAESKCRWNAYDPDADRWHPLPRVRKANYKNMRGCSCVCVCRRLLVIGGCNNDVVMFDPFKQQWSIVSSMRTARVNFACAAIGNKVYVAGGSNSSATEEGLSTAEVYDPCMDRWEDLPPMPFALLECISISYGDQFHVVGKKARNSEFDTYLIFNPVNKQWITVEDLGSMSKLLCHQSSTVAGGHIYSIYDDDMVRVINKDTRNWCTLGGFPAIVLPGHVRPLKPFGFKVLGYKRYVYVLGGMALRFDTDNLSYDVVELGTVRFFDPTKVPLEWHDARSMPVPSSDIIGCALVEEC